MEKIIQLRKILKKLKLDGYIIPKNDEFFSEYTEADRDYLKHITNFTGSYGFAIILKDKNFLLVDGRYTLQAKKQISSNFKIINIPLQRPLKIKREKIGYDPKIFNERTLSYLFGKNNRCLIPVKQNLIKPIKRDKKKFKLNKFYTLDNSITGESYVSKTNKIVNFLKKSEIDLIFISASENVAWLLNIRGDDSKYSPIPHSYLSVDSKKNINLFCDIRKINNEFRKKLNNIKIVDIKKIDSFLNNIINKKISIDSSSCSIYFKSLILKKNKILNYKDPTFFLKSIKNKTEINNVKRVHQMDGAAITKFIFWVKNNFENKVITEITAQNKLLNFKNKFKKFHSLSFPTISSTGSNGAIVHYNANKDTNKILKKGSLYLVDSGGQYYYGTTDVTRTISLRNNNKKIKEIFTRVLKGHINVCNYNFKKNTSGSDLDFVARKPLKQINLNYAHGTGHGVGYFLNVHEGPQSISKLNKIKLVPGMILSNEPGYYLKGKFGIRIENLVFISKERNKTKFENLTYVPIDKDLILKSLLNKNEIKWLNEYHQLVFKKIKKYMTKSELIYLKQYCSDI